MTANQETVVSRHRKQQLAASTIQNPSQELKRVSIIESQEIHKAYFEKNPQPQTAIDWVSRAREVAEILAIDAVERDHQNQVPRREIQLLKDAGLLTVLGPQKYGGAGQPWSTAYRIIREIAKKDGSIGMLIGYHYFWAWYIRLVGLPEQVENVEETYVKNNYFMGGSVNPRDKDTLVTEQGDGVNLILNGDKYFSTGARVSDLCVLYSVLESNTKEEDKHMYFIVPTVQDSIVFKDNWDNLGMRLTVSGGCTIRNLHTKWTDALGYKDKVYQKRIYNILDIPTVQLVFTSFYLGIAIGALETAASYTRTSTRPWPFGGDVKESATDEFYILETYGDLQSKLWATEALVDKVVQIVSDLHERQYNKIEDTITERERGEAAVLVAAAKQRAHDTGFEVTNKIFEVTGARATARKYSFDIFWRNLRTHSLHDPVAYKRREVGRFVLVDELPTPSYYT